MAENTGNPDFLYDFNSFNKNWEWRGGLLYFIAKLYKYVSRKLEHKMRAVVSLLCWYFFI